ncbi:hypothetical protein [Deinococcus humi]|uniref:Uncharacterized protein n=1 Tax=Deinococcus humi TaxID=662880 RepID=A0A7W8NG98_9DEIO|nr:hypothetical protein [Deinococcus humi]MBB5366299.1 hypothetical protein [Deinococcus humi]GGO33548.1 hypothetical protein GCM10008949_32910 [Deinococcus humi]
MKPCAIAARWKDQIPTTTAHLLELHVNHGSGVLSGFSLDLLSGEAFRAVCSADAENRARLGALLAMVAQDFPLTCYGSREAVLQWQGLKHTPPLTVPDSWTATVEELRREGPQYGEPEGKSALGELH